MLVEGVVKTLAGATEAADFGLDLDAMASEAFPEVLPKFPTTKRNVSPIVRNNARIDGSSQSADRQLCHV